MNADIEVLFIGKDFTSFCPKKEDVKKKTMDKWTITIKDGVSSEIQSLFDVIMIKKEKKNGETVYNIEENFFEMRWKKFIESLEERYNEPEEARKLLFKIKEELDESNKHESWVAKYNEFNKANPGFGEKKFISLYEERENCKYCDGIMENSKKLFKGCKEEEIFEKIIEIIKKGLIEKFEVSKEVNDFKKTFEGELGKGKKKGNNGNDKIQFLLRGLIDFSEKQQDSKDIAINIYKRAAESFFEEYEKNEKLQIIGRRELEENDNRNSKYKNKYVLYKDDFNNPGYGDLVGMVRKEFSCYDFVEQFWDALYFDDKGLGKTKFIEEYVKGKNDDIKIAVTIKINSRFDKSEKKPYFLVTMLTKGNIVINNHEVPGDEEQIFDVLLLWKLKEYLLRAYQKGVYHTYQNFKENGTRIRGSIDIARHIKLNMGLDNGNVAYSYREKTADNYLNHLIILAYEYLKKKYYESVVINIDDDPEASAVINILKYETSHSEYSKKYLMEKNSTPISHPYYTEYEELREVCCAILRDEGFSWYGEGEDVGGILYYIPDLWEEFVESKLSELSIWAQQAISVFNGKERGYNKKIIPDIVFVDEQDKPFMILDAKFKPAWYEEGHRKANLYNLFDDYVECVRNMNAIKAHATGTIFPYDSDERVGSEGYDQIIRHSISEYNDVDSFYTVPILVPDIEEDDTGDPEISGYEKWLKKFDDSINKTIEQLKKAIEIEEKKYHMINDTLKDIPISDWNNDIDKLLAK